VLGHTASDGMQPELAQDGVAVAEGEERGTARITGMLAGGWALAYFSSRGLGLRSMRGDEDGCLERSQ
jgi:hypothetical protein